MPQIIVDIEADGTTKVEAAGVVGSSCQQLTRAIEEALGQTTSDVKKPEFHRAAPLGQTNQATLGGGR